MTGKFTQKLGMERCLSCDHRWIDYEGVRGSCFLCGGTNISECISLKEIREAIAALRKEDKKYIDTHAKRTLILKQRYREIAELSLQRAQEIFSKVKEHYTRGNLTDKVVDQLIVAFRLFSELGVHKSAASIAYMTAMGYAQRGVEREIRSIEDLNDLVASRQWFIRLGSKDWEAAVNLHIGEKAMGTISTDASLLQTMMQVAVWHLYKARDFYFEHRNATMVERLQFDIERTTHLLTTYAQGASQIEAARITAQSTVKHGEQIRRGLESLGQSVQYGLTELGEHIENSGGSLSRALKSAAGILGTNVAGTMVALGAPSRLRGRSLDRRMSDMGQLIAASAREVPEGFLRPVNELGAKFALGAVGSTTNSEITSDPSIAKLADAIGTEVRKTEEGLKQLDEPSIKLTGTLLDTLVAKGMSKVLEQLESAEGAEKKRK